ncbi:23S rRNA (pseudouridine(1915)-N(3))-methyltransferase RlmH [Mediannikoviicoccus vaginalis]|uniref:23S rRNA (pseudouridine(1915)-N(3))-methyltransferase RlmH n=1 Tax=Mediannikoviicoccus vaginalis TaxID=2899727 RepID=UPI001F02C6CD|nr:23S rRNA (pseudouridine(1915)-N(3))-methyltransferase RlmH [Mediannikoviicoccus vaginalis]
MNVKIITIGSIKENYIKDGIAEFKKRIKSYANLEEIELKETLITDESSSNIEKALDDEAEKILSKINNRDYVIALDVKGRQYDSEDFSKKLEELKIDGYNDFVYIIGSSYGLSEKIKNRADLKLSFSKFTFPHQLMKLILFEQIYRWIKISKNEPYHK